MILTRTSLAWLTALGVSGLALAQFVRPAAPQDGPEPASVAPGAAHDGSGPRLPENCKPLAPIKIVIDGQSGGLGGPARIDFTLVPLIDVEQVWTEVRLLRGGDLVNLAGGSDGVRLAGETVQGSAHLALPAGHAVVELEAVFMMRTDTGELLRQSSVQTLEWGASTRQVELSKLGSEVTAVAPVLHRGGSPR